MKDIKLSDGVTTKEGVKITSVVNALVRGSVVTNKDGMLVSSSTVVNTLAVTNKGGVLSAVVNTLVNKGVVRDKDGILVSSPAIVVVNTAESVITGDESIMITGVLVRLMEKLGVLVKTGATLVGSLNRGVMNTDGVIRGGMVVDGSRTVIDGVGMVLLLSATMTSDETTNEGVAVNIVCMVRRSEVITIDDGAGCVVSTLGIIEVGTGILVVSKSVTAVVKTISKFGSGTSVSSTAACLLCRSCNLFASETSSPSTVINHLSSIFCSSSILLTDSNNLSSLSMTTL